jgi:general secretion pathway protein G
MKALRSIFLISICLLIVGLLAIPLLGIRGHPPESRVPADFSSIGSGLKAYRSLAGRYPTTEQGLMALVKQPTTEPVPRRWNQNSESFPTDPWQNEYRYRALPEDDPRGFELRSLGEDGKEGTKDDFSSLDPR